MNRHRQEAYILSANRFLGLTEKAPKRFFVANTHNCFLLNTFLSQASDKEKQYKQPLLRLNVKQ